MTPETSAWLSRKVPEFANLEPDEKNAIYDFSLLWSFFEGSKLNCNCNVKEIRRFVSQLNQRGRIDSFNIDKYVQYLQTRYYVDGRLTDHYKKLYLERSGNPAEVLEMLCNERCSTAVQLIGCLVVVFRLRNNLFHGEKWQYQIQGQLKNFQYANDFLRNIMDCA
ncbi:MAG: hypothetical protein AB7C96_12845 [Hydrogenovibrio sp.]